MRASTRSKRGGSASIPDRAREYTRSVGRPYTTEELVLHQGSGELQTVTGCSLIRPHSAAREDSYRLAAGLIGLEAMLRLYPEQERNERAFTALTRFLDTLAGVAR